jgi:TolB-like protein/Tfp pilus assembly protein PilF
VFRAVDTRLHRTVAIKVLPADKLGDSDRKRRFLQEARAASALSHPNIVTLHDISSDQGVDFLALEYVRGTTLKDLIPAGGLAPADVLRYGAQIASALAAAHAVGIVHRDIKPANIMVTPEKQVKVLDFGLAKLTPAVGPQDETRTVGHGTMPGVIMGTVAYMSPEQTRGEPLDGRSDVFPLGSVLYHAATGRLPFQGPSTLAIMHEIAAGKTAAASGVRSELGMEFDRVLDRAMAKDKQARATAAEMVEALEAMRLPSGPVAAPPATRELSRRWLIGAGGAAITAAGASVIWRMSTTGAAPSLAVMPLANATGDPQNDYVGDGIAGSVINRLSQTKLKVAAQTTAFRFKNLDPMAAGKQLNVAAVMTGRVTRQGANLVIQAELVNAADGLQIWGEKFVRPLAEVQVFEEEIARTIADKLHVRLTQSENAQLARHGTENPEAYRLCLQGQYYWNKYTEEGFVKAIECFTQAIRLDPKYALAYTGLAHAYAVQGADNMRPPKEVMPKAKEAAHQAIALDDTLAAAHTSMGMCHLFWDWDWNTAESDFRRALQLDPQSSDTMHFYSHHLEAVSRADEATALMKRAAEVDPLSLVIRCEYGFAAYIARRFEESAQILHQALEMDRDFIFAPPLLAASLEQIGRAGEAIQLLERARASGSPGILLELACAYAAGGRAQDARRLLAELVDRGKSEFIDPYFYAMITAHLHDRDGTVRWLEKAYEDRSTQIVWIKAEPKFDPVRDDKRFGEFGEADEVGVGTAPSRSRLVSRRAVGQRLLEPAEE